MRTLGGVIELVPVEEERVTRHGARVELDAEDALATVNRRSVALVALDYHVAPHCYPATPTAAAAAAAAT